MSTIITFRISGRVQGVFYRVSTQEKAMQLGLFGWVQNVEDGDVETLAVGSAEPLLEFERWLWQGPEHAKVIAVSKVELDANQETVRKYTSFDIL